MPGRRYSGRERIVAVLAADMTSQLAASEESGIPRSTIKRWLDDPKWDDLRHNARASMAEETLVVARLAWQRIAELLVAGKLEPRDLIILAGMSTDKSQLLNGAATSRTEAAVSIIESMPDHERAALRDAIERELDKQAVEA